MVSLQIWINEREEQKGSAGTPIRGRCDLEPVKVHRIPSHRIEPLAAGGGVEAVVVVV